MGGHAIVDERELGRCPAIYSGWTDL